MSYFDKLFENGYYVRGESPGKRYMEIDEERWKKIRNIARRDNIMFFLIGLALGIIITGIIWWLRK